MALVILNWVTTLLFQMESILQSQEILKVELGIYMVGI